MEKRSDFRSQFSLPFRSFQPCCPFSSLPHTPCAYFVPVHVCTRMFTFSFLLFYLFFRLFPFFFVLFPSPKQRVGRYTRSRHVKRGEITKFHGSVDIQRVPLSLSRSLPLPPSLSFSLCPLCLLFTFERLDFMRSFLIEASRSVRNPMAMISRKFRYTFFDSITDVRSLVIRRCRLIYRLSARQKSFTRSSV